VLSGNNTYGLGDAISAQRCPTAPRRAVCQPCGPGRGVCDAGALPAIGPPPSGLQSQNSFSCWRSPACLSFCPHRVRARPALPSDPPLSQVTNPPSYAGLCSIRNACFFASSKVGRLVAALPRSRSLVSSTSTSCCAALSLACCLQVHSCVRSALPLSWLRRHVIFQHRETALPSLPSFPLLVLPRPPPTSERVECLPQAQRYKLNST
jgi:hypothetical protein